MNFLSDYFTSNRRERRGTFLLCVLVLLLLAASWAAPFFRGEESVDFSAFERQIAALEPMNAEAPVTKTRGRLFRFDPNTLSFEGWLELGLTKPQAATILRYREKGGHFYRKTDLDRIYVLSEADIARLEPYVHISPSVNSPAKEPVKSLPASYAKERVLSRVDINAADSAVFVGLKGIGPVLASRILRYRERLGGFIAPEQLLEVYGMDTSAYRAFRQQLHADPEQVRKLGINTASAGELKNHPYVRTWALANALVNYRKQHGDFVKVEDIRKCVLVDGELYRKLLPYLETF
jgi:competence protein ComEA